MLAVTTVLFIFANDFVLVPTRPIETRQLGLSFLVFSGTSRNVVSFEPKLVGR